VNTKRVIQYFASIAAATTGKKDQSMEKKVLKYPKMAHHGRMKIPTIWHLQNNY